MLPTREVIEEVAHLFREAALPAPVVDPVVRSTSGFDLIDDVALAALVRELLPLARVVTPNIPEAERITGLRIVDEDGMRRAARAIRALGARAVLVKGGHLWEPTAVGEQNASSDQQRSASVEGKRATSASPESAPLAPDLLDEEGHVTIFREERIMTTSTHGTGCTLAAAIAACLGHGLTLAEAVGAAKSFVTEAIRRAPSLGHGHGPLNHTVTARLDRQHLRRDEKDEDKV
jgi:hydroxymethylpyrimidine/phosphomethylpyrimidine kinase